jgi:hypothetical protein
MKQHLSVECGQQVSAQKTFAHDAGHVVDWVRRADNYPMRVRVVMSAMLRLHSRNVQTTLEVLMKMGVPVDVDHLFDVVSTLEQYATTLANYCNLCGHEHADTLLYYIEQGANIDPAFFVEAGKHV